jgi:hypothetical protein
MEKVCCDVERKVIIQPLGKCDATDPHEWPSGVFLSSVCQTFAEQERLSSTPGSGITDQINQSTSADQGSIHEWWQASARRAILEKFGFVMNGSDSYTCDWKTSFDRALLRGEIDNIQLIWGRLVDEITNKQISRSINEEEDSQRLMHIVDRKFIQSVPRHPDFIDFVLNQCSKSNNRQLQWSMMSCPRGVQFPLHAHPNLELIYCARGELFEIRMLGEPITDTFEMSYTSDDSNTNTNPKVTGPTLTNTKRNWSFRSLKTGQWLVNEIGSVHKSFTSARSDGGCVLLVLWGGSHANIANPPISPDIQKAVDEMEEKLQKNDSCCRNSKMQFIPETFLPKSER